MTLTLDGKASADEGIAAHLADADALSAERAGTLLLAVDAYGPPRFRWQNALLLNRFPWVTRRGADATVTGSAARRARRRLEAAASHLLRSVRSHDACRATTALRY